MRREDLAELYQRERRRQGRFALFWIPLVLVWVIGLSVFGRLVFDWAGSGGLTFFILLAYMGVPLGLILFFGMRSMLRIPKCPHCGVRLLGPLLPTAIATGHCGHCGRNIES